MKKALSILAIALTLGVFSYQAANAGPGRGWGPCNCNGPHANTEKSENWQAFKKDTTDLRQQLREKRRAYFSLMNGEKVDKKKAETLWSDMFDLRAQIKAKAMAAGLQWPARSFGRHRWDGHGCNGPRGIGYSTDVPDGAPGAGPIAGPPDQQ
jgi:Spy/CpxP family protein refolding chaperone